MSILGMVDNYIAKQRYNEGYRRLWIFKNDFILTDEQVDRITDALDVLEKSHPTTLDLEHLSEIRYAIGTAKQVDDVC